MWKFVKAERLRSTPDDNYEKFNAAIQECLDDLATRHKAATDGLFTHHFQTFEKVPL